jgi:hypothetical protein
LVKPPLGDIGAAEELRSQEAGIETPAPSISQTANWAAYMERTSSIAVSEFGGAISRFWHVVKRLEVAYRIQFGADSREESRFRACK